MLTDADCRNASCPADQRRVRKVDAGGLYLEVTPNGAKRWFWKYRAGDKARVMALGHYAKPGGLKAEMSLKAARLARDEARTVHQTGADPIQKRQIAKATEQTSAALTFAGVAREFHKLKADGWSDAHASQWLRCCEKDLFPWLGPLPLRDVTAPVLLATLRRVEARGALQMVTDLRAYSAQVFKYGIQTGKCESNPARELTDAFKRHTVKHMAAVLTPAKAGELLRGIASYQGMPATRAALLLSALLFQRPGNIRALEWAWVNLAGCMLTIPAEAMKRSKAGKLNGRPHLVPLARRAVEALQELQPLTGHGRYVFPSIRTGEKPMSENTVNAALRGMGYSGDDMTAHGFRAMARTIMVENIVGIDPDVIEAQLAHGKAGPLGGAYDRAEYLQKRRELMQTWADYLDKLSKGADVVPIKGKAA
ncbi:MAG: integrase arm-type DNA-binding domain-containing protein [Burkholderiaceae bacterium]|nr:integrase arm-type DNA-binding domain-containing protein [Burkholderiaceae bacterium]